MDNIEEIIEENVDPVQLSGKLPTKNNSKSYDLKFLRQKLNCEYFFGFLWKLWLPPPLPPPMPTPLLRSWSLHSKDFKGFSSKKVVPEFFHFFSSFNFFHKSLRARRKDYGKKREGKKEEQRERQTSKSTNTGPRSAAIYFCLE